MVTRRGTMRGTGLREMITWCEIFLDLLRLSVDSVGWIGVLA